MHALDKNDSTSDVSYGERMFSKAISNYSEQQEVCSFTRLWTQCRPPESQHSNTRKSVCLVYDSCKFQGLDKRAMHDLSCVNQLIFI